MKLTIGLVAQPGTSRGNKTGSWRTANRPKFLKQRCNACNMCALVCPEGCVLGQGKNSYDADFDFCKGCGVCAQVCPLQDIEMVEEAKSHG